MEDYYYRQVIEKSSFGYANHRIVLDEENNPIDYIFLEVNEAFEKLTGLKKEQVLGKSLKTVLPPDAIKDFDWVKIYSEVALEGKELKDLKEFLDVYAYRIVQKWIEYFVYGINLNSETIQRKLK